jgi:pSer/pThr/pTyr-binding forkhead associated (FHA) protein
MLYAPLPNWVLEPDVRVPHASFLTITRTAQRIELPDKKTLLVGRANPTLNFVPDIDLSSAGDMANCVSRKHVRLTLRWGKHFIQDLNSTNGTRLNGHPIRFKSPPRLLHPGDHLWLGGCVLAYEWQLL